jgi:uncharacterized membrane protein YeaQ/YmgE (transglycosylase-associated protein family)
LALEPPDDDDEHDEPPPDGMQQQYDDPRARDAWGAGFFIDIVLGIVGAIIGGFLFTAFGANGVTGFNLYSMFVAVIGAIVVLVLYHTIVRQRAY